MSVQHATSCYGVGENGVPCLSQKVRNHAWTDTHPYTQIIHSWKKLILNIVVSTVAVTKYRHMFNNACLSGKNTAFKVLKSHNQALSQTLTRDSRIPLSGHKLLLPNLALVRPLLLQSSVLEHGLSSKCQLTSSSPRTAILLHLSSELANSADTFNNKWLSATLVSTVFFYKESWADNGLLWKQGRTGQTSKADLSFCIRKLKQSLIF